ncbi:di-trans,poly-cis-decaprenylcistransferase [Halanaerobiaceae bacterium Z-7014]|uniref:Isoprenyl transferase n=1 Tax=Halonatronomonas betaini TaxID=2778430 RepID=A0A931F8L7_9FIRM|nr:polyprenyl diphosphate synthase [Halonatronomonas betaini]MBF8436678.1 di-trans,poly-cis-decaprenylcistransferase [Halonatronomonas betaini]
MKSLKHIAIIMDGNGRWANKRSRPRKFGHREGLKALERVAKAANELGIEYLTVFAFSTENWQRPRSEVDFLFQLLRSTVRNEFDKLQQEEDIKIKVIGRIDELEDDIQADIKKIEEVSKDNKGLQLNIAVNYGGRAEIVDALNKALKSEIETIDEEEFNKLLYAPELNDVDLLIRTANEKRVSNFLLWQISYAEFYFTSTLWPDFDKIELEKAIDEYNSRKRKFGSLPGEELN